MLSRSKFFHVKVVRLSSALLSSSKSTVSTNNKPVIGFIGLGNMGFSMASNLLKSSIAADLLVYDLKKSSVDELVSKGAKAAASIEEIGNKCSIVITMVPNTTHVTGILRGNPGGSTKGLFDILKKGSLVIDSSTIDPLVSKDLHLEAESQGVLMLDAPVSGGVTGAAAGTLTFMVGGHDSTLELAKVSNFIDLFKCDVDVIFRFL